MSGPLLVPLGRYLGMLPVDDGARVTLEHVVRLDGRRVVLSDDEMLIWALAHGTPNAPGPDRWDRAAVRGQVPAGTAGVDATIERLLGSGPLMEVGDPVEFARAVRLLPQALGLGNSAERPRVFGVGQPGAPLVLVPTGTFYVWAWACLAPDLWTACERGAAASDPPGATDAHGLLTDLLGGLHALLATDAACLDLALLDTARPDTARPDTAGGGS